ncbi:MAG: tRNA preQ1(34) S-adenosylmethionine ribosyltransferase-isomerase QueA [Gemmatimonadaceae bacterium]|nr:tRNA preQ1(34) S-adenosylmethionine ribosyltransferase-isomerase QueA [Gemmatimonadaceae bacterium]
MSTRDFDYALPPDRIARVPADRRDQSRLLVVDRSSGTFRHLRFADLAGLIPPGDAIVLNTTRVIRARLLGRRDSGAPAEVFLLRPTGAPAQFEALVHPGGKLHAGRVVHVADGLDVVMDAVTDRRTRLVSLRTTLPPDEAIERHGHVPLPPYLQRADDAADRERYQTVYAREHGSVAAPTAGLHFTSELLATLAARGVERIDVLLHVGAGTFKPVEVDDPADHVMHPEPYLVSDEAAARCNAVRAAGRHLWAVGTTVTRTLESVTGADGIVRAGAGETSLFIRPGYQFRAVDRLITNFHLPRSTLLMLVAAFAGYDLAMEAYRVALDSDYRFYSYGDAMVIT